jgi:4'-phosphopantetheinyl transferase
LICKICDIEKLKQDFGVDNSLSNNKNISLLAKKFLVKTLQEQGLSFDFTIKYGENGKPFFINNKEVHFSISHSKDYVAIAVDNQEIGVDVESLRTNKKQIAQRFFTIKENKYLNNYKDNVYDEAFTQLWTMKESFVKQSGEGIADNFNKISIVPKKFSSETMLTINNVSIYSKFFEKEKVFLSICCYSSSPLTDKVTLY